MYRDEMQPMTIYRTGHRKGQLRDDRGKFSASRLRKNGLRDLAKHVHCCSSFPRMPSSYQVVLWKQESFLVPAPD